MKKITYNRYISDNINCSRLENVISGNQKESWNNRMVSGHQLKRGNVQLFGCLLQLLSAKKDDVMFIHVLRQPQYTTYRATNVLQLCKNRK